EAFRVWEKSRHARALATLETRGVARDPECAVCHVVGLETAGGFTGREATPALGDVGCEACHGPAAAHAAAPLAHRPPSRGGDCATCHAPDHSPGFERAA